MKHLLLIVSFTFCSAVVAASHFGQEPPAPSPQEPQAPSPQEQPAAAPQGGGGARGGRGQAGEPRPYDQVITKEARTDEGIFTGATVLRDSSKRVGQGVSLGDSNR